MCRFQMTIFFSPYKTNADFVYPLGSIYICSTCILHTAWLLICYHNTLWQCVPFRIYKYSNLFIHKGLSSLLGIKTVWISLVHESIKTLPESWAYISCVPFLQKIKFNYLWQSQFELHIKIVIIYNILTTSNYALNMKVCVYTEKSWRNL